MFRDTFIKVNVVYGVDLGAIKRDHVQAELPPGPKQAKRSKTLKYDKPDHLPKDPEPESKQGD